MGFKRVQESGLAVSACWMLLLIALLGQSVSAQESGLTSSPDSAVLVQEEAMTDDGPSDVAPTESASAVSESLEKFGDRSLRDRLVSYVFFGGLLLVFLALLFGYLRLDHATRGFHSGRLQIAALALLAIVLVVGYLLWTQVLFK